MSGSTDHAVLDEYEAGELSVLYDAEPAQEVVAWALDRFHPRMAISEGGGAEGMAILDMAVRIEPNVRVFTIDTGRLPQETYDLIERVQQRYAIRVEVLFPEKAHIEGMMKRHGPNLMYDAVDLRLLCCQVRKVVPYHALYDQGYTSIGCAPCTRPIQQGEPDRAGRWWWEKDAPKECGIHCAIYTGGFEHELHALLNQNGNGNGNGNGVVRIPEAPNGNGNGNGHGHGGGGPA